MASRRKKPLSAEALRKKRSEAAKKGWKTRRRAIRAERVGTQIFESWGKLGTAYKQEAETRKRASNSRIYGDDKEKISRLEKEAKQAEKQRKKLEAEVAKLKGEAAALAAKLKREAAALSRLQNTGLTPKEKSNIVETIELSQGRENWVDIMPQKYLRRDGGIALNPCRLRHTTETTRWHDMLEQAEEQDGGQIAGPSVQAAVKRIMKEYVDYGYEDYFPDEEPLDEHEIWTLYFSP